jgi:hypothetical protein
VAFALAQALLLADAVTPDALGQALHLSAAQGASLVRSLQALGTLEPLRIEQQLEKGGAPAMRHVAPVEDLVARLPPGLCERLLVLPVRQDPRTGTVDVAVVDARDTHAAEEVAFWLGSPVRMVRTSLASMDAAFRRLEEKPASLGMQALAPPIDTAEPVAPEPPGPGPNIPIPLTRRPSTIVELPVTPAPAEERGARDSLREPVLDLQRRKPAAPTSVVPTTQRGPFSPDPRLAQRPAAPPLAPPSASAPTPSRAPAPAALHSAAPPAPAGPPVDALAELRGATDRDRVVDLIVTGTRMVAGRVAVLTVRRDVLTGWACSAEIADPATFRKVTLATTPPTVLTEVIEQGGAWLARFPRDLAHAPLIELLRQPPDEEVAIAGVRVEGRATLVILAANLADRPRAKKALAELALEAGEALARILRERRK